MFYQTIFQYILNGYFVLNNGNKKGTFWAYVKTKYICVWYWFIFLKNSTVRYIVDFVNKTLRDKGRACSNEKRKRFNRISSDKTLGLNYPTACILFFRFETPVVQKLWGCWQMVIMCATLRYSQSRWVCLARYTPCTHARVDGQCTQV